jgi:cytochrome c biogenesis protein CcmG, thiol:disulfide interchange protein DsbE
MKGRLILWVPLIGVLLLGLLFAWGLMRGEDRLVASQWIDQPLPAFELGPATDGVAGLTSTGMATGEPRLLNFFASWCVPCRAEAAQLDAIAAAGVPIDGIAIRDRAEDVARYLAETGNPYARIGADPRSQVQIAFGSSGVPETFLVDGRGIIRKQIQGIITPDMVPGLLAELRAMR